MKNITGNACGTTLSELKTPIQKKITARGGLEVGGQSSNQETDVASLARGGALKCASEALWGEANRPFSSVV